MGECKGCDRGWERVRHKPWPEGSKPMYFHKVKGGREGELFFCTQSQHQPPKD